MSDAPQTQLEENNFDPAPDIAVEETPTESTTSAPEEAPIEAESITEQIIVEPAPVVPVQEAEVIPDEPVAPPAPAPKIYSVDGKDEPESIPTPPPADDEPFDPNKPFTARSEEICC